MIIETIKLTELPSTTTKRWVMNRKAQVIAAISNGIMSFEEACQRYNIAGDELKSWIRLINAHGVRGLRATKIQQYRS